MRLEAAIEGKLDEFLKSEAANSIKAVSAAIELVTSGIVKDGRQQIISAGLGNGLSKALRDKFYSNGKSGPPAGIVFSKAKYMDVFEEGAVIAARNVKWLAIPTKAVGRSGRKRLKPNQIPNLVFVETRKSGLAMLLVKRGNQSIVYFWLVRQVTIKKRLNIYAAAEKWEDQLPKFAVDEWEKQKTSNL